MMKHYNPSYKSLLWIMPFLTGLHNLEEAPSMVGFLARYLPDIHFVTEGQFYAALIIATLGEFAIVYASLYFLERGVWRYVPVALQSLVFLNALSHICGSLMFRTAAPGVFTAVLLIIPFTPLVYRAALREKYVDRRGLTVAFLAGAVAYLPLVALSLLAGTLAVRMLQAVMGG